MVVVVVVVVVGEVGGGDELVTCPVYVAFCIATESRDGSMAPWGRTPIPTQKVNFPGESAIQLRK